eukprot:CAMPEP_0118945782 /NCGR_PEP_ID=MMETSP1169-20130426/42961_1 /TAXON_ID=36882 /ORGANISM="Pyramimonas obovata, Strain CCMP722" /LENGTH=162 /DNA_ID=CAMNT_0006891575 /DNA_START=78 /DNA_END=562 /DNA_ORIENTATION=+
MYRNSVELASRCLSVARTSVSRHPDTRSILLGNFFQSGMAQHLQASKRARHTVAFSHLPENTVYGGPVEQQANSHKRVTLKSLKEKYLAGEPLSMLTAYDYPSAVHVDRAGADILLVGDSVAMVVHGHDTTLPITMDEMLMHSRAVARGATRPLLVGDLPFG